MIIQQPHHSNAFDPLTHFARRFIYLIGLLFVIVPAFGFGLMRLALAYQPTVMEPLWILFGLPFFFLQAFVLSYWWGYSIFCLAIILSTLALLIQRHIGWRTKVLATLTLGLTLFYMLFPYSPAVQPTEGHQMIVLTEPPLLLRGLKRTQAAAEVRPCTYKVHGWQENTLYYAEMCGQIITTIRTWQFTAGRSNRPTPYHGQLPSALVTRPLSQDETKTYLHAEASYPSNTDLTGLYVQQPGIPSPDGKWVAFVSEYLYGAADVVLVSTSLTSDP